MRREGVDPGIEGGHGGLLHHHVVGLVVGVGLAEAEGGVRPERVGNLDARIAALPDEPLIGEALVPVGLVLGVEPGLLVEDLGAPVGAEIVAALVAIAEERRRAARQMVSRQLRPEGRALKGLGLLVSFLSMRSGRGLPPLAQTRRSKRSLRFEVGPYHQIGPMKAHASARASRR